MSADLDSYRGAVIDDINIDGCRLLVVGINPGLWTAKVGAPFARPGTGSGRRCIGRASRPASSTPATG